MKVNLNLSPSENALRKFIAMELDKYGIPIDSNEFDIFRLHENLSWRLHKLNLTKLYLQHFPLRAVIIRFLYLKMLSDKINKPIKYITETDILNTQPLSIPNMGLSSVFGLIIGGFPFKMRANRNYIIGFWNKKLKKFISKDSSGHLIAIILNDNKVYFNALYLGSIDADYPGYVPCMPKDLEIILDFKDGDVVTYISSKIAHIFQDYLKLFALPTEIDGIIQYPELTKVQILDDVKKINIMFSIPTLDINSNTPELVDLVKKINTIYYNYSESISSLSVPYKINVSFN